ncbi:hypothetical protein FDW83_10205 [Pseudarthrobacter sp. NamE2]|uniref:hypothetical protein n=1 Tax=Pseudarthrobacter sp. NamE2 TaxID=2576838 RepID=UPI0010FCF72F|nr:hypothetical protein [Pseudarthrobacter sp. NamE2]TLM83332.1 hypothetical protein FDW83_10205 [Pseudarthrobacter sp. NamE2]
MGIGLHRLTIFATTRAEAEEKLNSSVQQLRDVAMQNPTRGILVTKRGAGHFTVELSDQVPYGQTWESVTHRDSAS